MSQWWLWTYVVVMAVAALWFARWSRDARGIPKSSYWLVVTILLWSGVWHAVMALGGGQTESAGRPVDWARYTDWAVTAPLLAVALARTATHAVPDKRWGLVVTMVAATLPMILLGLVGEITTGGVARFMSYGLGLVALGVLFSLIWGPLRATAKRQPPPMASLYQAVALLLTMLWAGFPLVWILGPSGIELFGEDTNLALYLLLSATVKVGWSVVDVGRLRVLSEHGHLVVE